MPEFQGWLKKSPINMDKAFCGPCQSELRAHFTDLSDGVIKMMCLPLSNAEVERTLLQLHYITFRVGKRFIFNKSTL